MPQKKATRLVTNSSYFAHTTPLLLAEGLLKMSAIFKLKLLTIFYKLFFDLLPPYFCRYRDVIDKDPASVLRRHLIHQSMIKRAYAECSPLYQLIK